MPLDHYHLLLDGQIVADARPIADFNLSESVFQLQLVAPVAAKPAGGVTLPRINEGKDSKKAMGNVKPVLLISNSTQHGSGYLDHCAAEIKDFLGPKYPLLIHVCCSCAILTLMLASCVFLCRVV